IEAFGVRLRLVPIALKHGWTTQQQFTIRGKFGLNIRQRLPHAPHAAWQMRVERDHRRGLRKSVAFLDANAGVQKPSCGLEAQRGASRNKCGDTSAKSLLNFAEHEAIRQLPGRLPRRLSGE